MESHFGAILPALILQTGGRTKVYPNKGVVANTQSENRAIRRPRAGIGRGPRVQWASSADPGF